MTRKASMTAKAITVTAVMLFTMLLAACSSSPTEGSAGGSAGAGPGSSGAATPIVQAGASGSTGSAAGNTAAGSQGGAANTTAGNASAGSAGSSSSGVTATVAVTDVGSASNGVKGGSNGATGGTAPNAATAGDNAPSIESGNTGSGTGDTTTGGTGTAGTTGAGGRTATGGNTNGGKTATGGNAAGGNSAPVTGVYVPVSNADCTAVQKQLSTALGVDVSLQGGSAAFTDLNNKAGQSCRLMIKGTGKQFKNVPDTAQRIAKVFTDAGWAADPVYAADSPTGTIGGLRKGKQLAAYNIGWTPAQGVNCPQDQPISACANNLAPEQMNYTITVDLAQEQ